MGNGYTLNSECFDEKDSPQQQYQLFKKVKENPDLFQEIKNQSGKTNLATIITTGAIITTLTIGGLIIGNYLCEKIIPQAYQALQEQFKK